LPHWCFICRPRCVFFLRLTVCVLADIGNRTPDYNPVDFKSIISVVEDFTNHPEIDIIAKFMAPFCPNKLSLGASRKVCRIAGKSGCKKRRQCTHKGYPVVCFWVSDPVGKISPQNGPLSIMQGVDHIN